MSDAACFVFGAGPFYGLVRSPQPGDCILAADGGYRHCQAAGLKPDLLLGDFDSLGEVPDFGHVLRLPVEKDDTDMVRAVKEGLAKGEKEFHLLGGMGGQRSDHTVANMQTLAYLAAHGAKGWLYGDGERYTAICGPDTLTLASRDSGILSVFCLGADAAGVTIRGAQYELENAALTAFFPLGVSNHFVGKAVRVSVDSGCLLIGIHDKE